MRDYAATVRKAQCTVEANKQGVAVLPWYLLEGKMGMKIKRPYDPVEGVVEADEEWETSYAVSAPVPGCALWNLLNNWLSDDDMLLLSAAEWHNFVVGRSRVGQAKMEQTMERVLLRARWADACCQKMFTGWKLAVLGRQFVERKLMGMTAACNAARRGALRDKEAMAESRNQSSELQKEKP